MSVRSRWQPYLLLLVYVGPLVAAAVFYFSGYRITAAPHGELLDVPQAMPAMAVTTASGETAPQDWLERRWSLIYAPQQHCAEVCIERLNHVNQVRLALGKHMGRAQVVLLYSGPVPSLPDGADVMRVSADASPGQVIQEFLTQQTSADSRIYIGDPLGRLVIAYPPDVEQADLLEDLERLLAVM